MTRGTIGLATNAGRAAGVDATAQRQGQLRRSARRTLVDDATHLAHGPLDRVRFDDLDADGDPDGALDQLLQPIARCPGDDVAYVRELIAGRGVAAIPASVFFSEPARGRGLVRFVFCKRLETLRAAGERL